MEPGYVLMRFPWKKYIFPGILLLAAVLVLILYQRLGSGGMMAFHEAWSNVGAGSHNDEHWQHNLRDDSHHHHHHDDSQHSNGAGQARGHAHNEEVRFVLHESALGAPEFIGRNQRKAIFIDFDGGNTFLNAPGDSVAGAFSPGTYKDNNIAIGLAITTREQADVTKESLSSELPFFKVISLINHHWDS